MQYFVWYTLYIRNRKRGYGVTSHVWLLVDNDRVDITVNTQPRLFSIGFLFYVTGGLSVELSKSQT